MWTCLGHSKLNVESTCRPLPLCCHSLFPLQNFRFLLLVVAAVFERQGAETGFRADDHVRSVAFWRLQIRGTLDRQRKFTKIVDFLGAVAGRNARTPDGWFTSNCKFDAVRRPSPKEKRLTQFVLTRHSAPARNPPAKRRSHSKANPRRRDALGSRGGPKRSDNCLYACGCRGCKVFHLTIL